MKPTVRLTDEEREALAEFFKGWFSNGNDYGREHFLEDADEIAPVLEAIIAARLDADRQWRGGA